jgi:hypothetical protein
MRIREDPNYIPPVAEGEEKEVCSFCIQRVRVLMSFQNIESKPKPKARSPTKRKVDALESVTNTGPMPNPGGSAKKIKFDHGSTTLSKPLVAQPFSQSSFPHQYQHPHPHPHQQQQQRFFISLPAIQPEAAFPCCLCVSVDARGLLHVQDPPKSNATGGNTRAGEKGWMAHESCADVVPETWIDKNPRGERVVFGVSSIPRDRWNLVSLLSRVVVNSELIKAIEMLLLHETSTQDPRCSNPMHERQMSKGLPCQLRSGVGRCRL